MDHEEIRFVHTPPCRLCRPTAERKRRYPCIGCTKPAAKQPPLPVKKNRKLRKIGQYRRDCAIAKLRENGLSLGEISKILKIPRSTVFNAVKRLKKSVQNEFTT